MDESINVFGEVLQDCSLDPVTGFLETVVAILQIKMLGVILYAV